MNGRIKDREVQNKPGLCSGQNQLDVGARVDLRMGWARDKLSYSTLTFGVFLRTPAGNAPSKAK